MTRITGSSDTGLAKAERWGIKSTFTIRVKYHKARGDATPNSKVRFGVQSRMNPHRTQHSLGLILNALHSSHRDERGLSSLLLSMHSKSTLIAGISPGRRSSSMIFRMHSTTEMKNTGSTFTIRVKYHKARGDATPNSKVRFGVQSQHRQEQTRKASDGVRDIKDERRR